MARRFVVLLITLAAGCAGVAATPSAVMVQSEPLIVVPPETGRNADEPVPAPRPPAETREEARAALAVPTPRQPVEAEPPPARKAAKIPAAKVALAPAERIEVPAPAARRLEATLDVASLKARLRDTNAIGVFTKLSLKNQVDDLLKGFRAHYLDGQKPSVASLRQPYDMLVLKVLALLQDADPPLARTISGSREAIWNILTDPEQFKTVI